MGLGAGDVNPQESFENMAEYLSRAGAVPASVEGSNNPTEVRGVGDAFGGQYQQ